MQVTERDAELRGNERQDPLGRNEVEQHVDGCGGAVSSVDYPLALRTVDQVVFNAENDDGAVDVI